ncbi:MAG: rod shape-determining protein MreD [Nitrospinota bacterium]
MYLLFYLLLFLATIVFQTTVAEYVADGVGAKPDLVLLAVLYAGARRKGGVALSFGFLLGLAQDILSEGLLGSNAFSKGLLGYLMAHVRRHLAMRNVSTWLGLGLTASVADACLIALSLLVFLPEVPIPAAFLPVLAKGVALNTVLAPIVFHTVDSVEERLVRAPMGAGLRTPPRA